MGGGGAGAVNADAYRGILGFRSLYPTIRILLGPKGPHAWVLEAQTLDTAHKPMLGSVGECNPTQAVRVIITSCGCAGLFC